MVRICVVGDPHGDFARVKKVPKDVDIYLLRIDNIWTIVGHSILNIHG